MRGLFLLILMIAPVIANSQSFSIPTSILDSLLWGYERGISCDSLRLAQANLIRSQGLELASTGKELELCKAGSIEKDSLIITAKKGQEIQGKQFALDLSKEKKKTKKWKKGFFIIIVAVVVREGLNALD